jgi:hypothetical protein
MKLKTSLGVEDNPDTSSLIDGRFRYDQFGFGVPAGHFLGMLRQKGFKTLVDEAIKYRSKEPQASTVGAGGAGGSGNGSVKKPRQKRKQQQQQPMEGASSSIGAAPTTLDLSHHGAWEGGAARLADGNFTPPLPKRSAPSIQGKEQPNGSAFEPRQASIIYQQLAQQRQLLFPWA